MTNHVVGVSSGTVSAYLWRLMVERHGPENVVGVFCDVNGEHEDNYRFLAEVVPLMDGSPLVRIDNDGATIWTVFRAEKFLGNSRVAPCARQLKFEATLAWMEENCDLATMRHYIGIDWTESRRFTGYKDRKGKWHPGLLEKWSEVGVTAEAPMIPKELDKGHALAWLESVGVLPPLLTRLGFPHANCRGGCIKSGAKQFKNLLRLLPDEFAWWERNEEETRAVVGDHAILRDRRDGGTKPLPLSRLRAIEQAQPGLFDADDRSACGCFTFDDDEDKTATPA